MCVPLATNPLTYKIFQNGAEVFVWHSGNPDSFETQSVTFFFFFFSRRGVVGCVIKSSTCWCCSVESPFELEGGGGGERGEREGGRCWRGGWWSLVFCSVSQTQKRSRLSFPHMHKHFDTVRQRKDTSGGYCS